MGNPSKMLDTQAPLRREKITHLGIRSEGDEAKITSSIQLPMREIPAEIDLLFTLFLTSFLVGCPPQMIHCSWVGRPGVKSWHLKC